MIRNKKVADDASQDRTVEIAQRLGIDVVIRHEKILGMVEIKKHVTGKR
ncbi:MAG: hypothetical protein HYZ84_03350 [Candidatus Omnitrophica bacterium]|nr:hypothetical protein [Candidatus Omnitrophota bacterium]